MSILGASERNANHSEPAEVSYADRAAIAVEMNTPPVLDKTKLRKILADQSGPRVTREAVLGSLIYYYFDVLDLIFSKVKEAQLSKNRLEVTSKERGEYKALKIEVATAQDLKPITSVIVPSLRKLLRAYLEHKPQDEIASQYLVYLRNFEDFVVRHRSNMTSESNFVTWQQLIEDLPALPSVRYTALIKMLNNNALSS